MSPKHALGPTVTLGTFAHAEAGRGAEPMSARFWATGGVERLVNSLRQYDPRTCPLRARAAHHSGWLIATR